MWPCSSSEFASEAQLCRVFSALLRFRAHSLHTDSALVMGFACSQKEGISQFCLGEVHQSRTLEFPYVGYSLFAPQGQLPRS